MQNKHTKKFISWSIPKQSRNRNKIEISLIYGDRGYYSDYFRDKHEGDIWGL